jgi:hypothetical protein
MAEEFHVGIGGPFWRLGRAAHVDSLRRLIPLMVGATWLPLALLTLGEKLINGRPEMLMRDLTVHTRLLIALPLFLIADRLLDYAAGVAVRRLFDEGYVPQDSTLHLRTMLRHVGAWRDAALPEWMLLALALFSGVLALAGVIPPAGAIHGVSESAHGPVRMWYALVSLPLFQFFLWRSIYRWGLWVRVLAGIARTPLRLLPGHADKRAGISFLKTPTVLYCSVILFAVSSVLCAGWGTQVRMQSLRVEAIQPLFLAYVLIGVLIAFAPLLLFTPTLFKARMAGRRHYGNLVSDYTRRFEVRWIDRTDRPDLLGTQDIQALSDLGQSYREGIEQMQALLFGPRDWLVLLVAAFLPAAPLLLAQGGTHEVLKRILKLLLGGMPI